MHEQHDEMLEWRGPFEPTLDSLDLKVGRSFGYWFGFGDD